MQSCQVCFDSCEGAIAERPCGHRVCAPCEEACSANSSSRPANSSPCPASSLCSGAPLLEENETPEQAFARITRGISDLEEKNLSDTMLLSWNLNIEETNYRKRLESLPKNAATNLVKDYINLVRKTLYSKLIVLKSREYFDEKIAGNPYWRADLDFELTGAKIENDNVISAQYYAHLDGTLVAFDWKNGYCTVKSNRPHVPFSTIKARYNVFWGIVKVHGDASLDPDRTDISKTITHTPVIDETNSAWKTLFDRKKKAEGKLYRNFALVLDNNSRELKRLEQQLEQLEEKLQGRIIDTLNVPAPSSYSIDLQFTKIAVKARSKILQNWNILTDALTHRMEAVSISQVIPLLVRTNFRTPCNKPSVGGVALIVPLGGCPVLLTFKGDPLGVEVGIKRRGLSVLVDPEFSLLGVVVCDDYVIFPYNNGKYNAISIDKESWGKFSKVAMDPVRRPEIESPWPAQGDFFSFFRHEPTRTFYLCSSRQKQSVPFASQRF